uniref:6-phosphogluconate dehydrogenase NADP-binding domain-containing protein n=1 Tax=Fagus sylvatica TaxID=28930 RepID=A0A2N9F178_FAGSY
MATTTTTSSTSEPISPSNTRVGWIGTGFMGRSMCSHLKRWLSSIPSPKPNTQAHWPTPHSACFQSDVVFSIRLPSDVRSVLLDPNLEPSASTGDISLVPFLSIATGFSSWTRGFSFPALHHCRSLVVICRPLHCHRYPLSLKWVNLC